jgi:hypothetical protein
MSSMVLLPYASVCVRGNPPRLVANITAGSDVRLRFPSAIDVPMGMAESAPHRVKRKNRIPSLRRFSATPPWQCMIFPFGFRQVFQFCRAQQDLQEHALKGLPGLSIAFIIHVRPRGICELMRLSESVKEILR